jgi:hypothetical protein
MRRRGIGRAGRPGLVRTATTTAVVAGTATAVSGKVAQNQQARAAQAAQAAPPPEPAPAPATAAQAADPMVEQLTQLAALRDQGILTEDEFAAKKAKILGI